MLTYQVGSIVLPIFRLYLSYQEKEFCFKIKKKFKLYSEALVYSFLNIILILEFPDPELSIVIRFKLTDYSEHMYDEHQSIHCSFLYPLYTLS